MIAVYYPVNPKMNQISDESDKFYADLQDTINDVPANDMLIIGVI
jgi:hypothetical protein